MRFERYIGIDYSGAATPTSGRSGLRVFEATRSGEATRVDPPPSRRVHWTRQGVATWLVDRLLDGTPTFVGIDHGFSFPIAYFERHGLDLDWTTFLDDFCAHWPTDVEDMTVQRVQDGEVGRAAARTGDPTWFRETERRTGSAKSVFRFKVHGQVAMSTHAGLPWLRHVRTETKAWIWPFDGWTPPTRRTVVAEVYPRLWNRRADRGRRTPDEHDAWSIARAVALA
ncbi:MAG: hypothetical protein KDA28_02395, partial [Phycisphaerales bacterium]|nr:hypothetical protein [Phycisphaerales bacterium]